MLGITTVFEYRNMTLCQKAPLIQRLKDIPLSCVAGSILCLLLVFELWTVCLDKALDMAPVLCC